MIRRWLVFLCFLTASGFPLPEEGPEQRSDNDSGEKTVCLRLNEIPSNDKVNTNLPQFLIEIMGPSGQKGIKYKILKVNEENERDKKSEPGTKTSFSLAGGSKRIGGVRSKLLVDSGIMNTKETPPPGSGKNYKIIPQATDAPDVHSLVTDHFRDVNTISNSTEQYNKGNEPSEAGTSTPGNHKHVTSVIQPAYTGHNGNVSIGNEKDAAIEEDSEEQFRIINTAIFSNDTKLLPDKIHTNGPSATPVLSVEDDQTTFYEPTTLHDTYNIPPKYGNPGFDERYHTDEPPTIPFLTSTTTNTFTTFPPEVILGKNGRLLPLEVITDNNLIGMLSKGDDQTTLYEHSTLHDAYSIPPKYGSSGFDQKFYTDESTALPLHAHTPKVVLDQDGRPLPPEVIMDENGRLIGVLSEEDDQTTSYEPSTLYDAYSIPPKYGSSGFDQKFHVEDKSSATPFHANKTSKTSTALTPKVILDQDGRPLPPEVILDENDRLIGVLSEEDDQATLYEPSTLHDAYSSIQPKYRSPTFEERPEDNTTGIHQNGQYTGDIDLDHTRTPNFSFEVIDPDDLSARTSNLKVNSTPRNEGALDGVDDRNNESSSSLGIYASHGGQYDQGYMASTFGQISDSDPITENSYFTKNPIDSLLVKNLKFEPKLTNGTEQLDNSTDIPDIGSSSDFEFEGEFDPNTTDTTTRGYNKIIFDLQDTETTPGLELPHSTTLQWGNPGTTRAATGMERTISTYAPENTDSPTHPPPVTFQPEMSGSTTVPTTLLNTEKLDTKVIRWTPIHTTPTTEHQNPVPTPRLLHNQPHPPPEPLSVDLATTRSPVTADWENFNNFTLIFPTIPTFNREPHYWRYRPDWFSIPHRIYFPNLGTP